jgi:hypothetical protein
LFYYRLGGWGVSEEVKIGGSREREIYEGEVEKMGLRWRLWGGGIWELERKEWVWLRMWRRWRGRRYSGRGKRSERLYWKPILQNLAEELSDSPDAGRKPGGGAISFLAHCSWVLMAAAVIDNG